MSEGRDVRHKRLLAPRAFLQRDDDHLQEVQAAVDELRLVQGAVGGLEERQLLYQRRAA